MTLRTRILLTTVGLAAVGLMVAAAATYHFLGTFLTDRVDQQVRVAVAPIAARLIAGDVLGGPPEAPVSDEARRAFLPDGSYGAVLDAEGGVLEEATIGADGAEAARPELPTDPAALRELDGSVVEVPAVGGGTAFRLTALPLVDGRTLVAAIPLTEVEATLRQLLVIEAIVTLVVLSSLALAAAWLARRELRPLDRMAETADAIAAGDLAQRVSPDDPRTEVGRLGRALNGMLAQIEEAFAERSASEQRLRQFVADASHELRTPLTAIRGYAELFRRGAASRPDDLARTMREIEEASERMGRLVRELLLLARLDEGDTLAREPVDLTTLAARAIDTARLSEPTRSFELDASDEVFVDGDDVRLRRVVDNLLSNAIRHAPASSTVHVRVYATNGSAALEVADEGPGIAPEHADRVFERFYRSDGGRSRESGGSGLGLAIVKSIVEAHAGAISHHDRPGGGTVFRVSLPARRGTS